MNKLVVVFGVLVCAFNVSASEYSEKWSNLLGAAVVTSESGAMMTVACYAGVKGIKLVTERGGFKNYQALLKVNSAPVTLLYYSVDGAEEDTTMGVIFEGAAFIPETAQSVYTNFIGLLKSGNSISIKVHTLSGETRQHKFTLAGSTAAIQGVDCK